MKTFTLLEYYMHVAKTLQQNNTDTQLSKAHLQNRRENEYRCHYEIKISLDSFTHLCKR